MGDENRVASFNLNEPEASALWRSTSPSLNTTRVHALANGQATYEFNVDQPEWLASLKADLAASKGRGHLSNVEIVLAEDMLALWELESLADAISDRIAAVRDNIRNALEATDERSFRWALGSATLASPPAVVKVEDEGLIPSAFFKSVPDKAKIAEALRAGKEVAGARLVQNGTPGLRVTFAKG